MCSSDLAAMAWTWDTDADLPSDEAVFSTEVAATTGNEWVDVTLESPVEIDGDFAVGMVFTTPPGDDGEESLLIGTDESAPDGRSYGCWSAGAWGTFESLVGFDADFMVRAVVVPMGD